MRRGANPRLNARQRAACIESLLESSIIGTGRMKITYLRFGMAKKTTTKSKPAAKQQGMTTKIAVIAAATILGLALIYFLFVRSNATAPATPSNANRSSANAPAKLDAY